jgi:hypothetical protein
LRIREKTILSRLYYNTKKCDPFSPDLSSNKKCKLGLIEYEKNSQHNSPRAGKRNVSQKLIHSNSECNDLLNLSGYIEKINLYESKRLKKTNENPK